MSFERVSFPQGISGSEFFIYLIKGLKNSKNSEGNLGDRLKDGITESFETLLDRSEQTNLTPGTYDLTPEPLRRARFQYNLVVMSKDAAILTKTLNPNRRHTPDDRVRDFFHLVRRGKSTLVKTYRMPPIDSLQIPTSLDLYFNDVFGVDHSQKVYSFIRYIPDNDDNHTEEITPTPTPGDLVSIH